MAIYYCHMFRQEEEVLTWKTVAGCTARFSSTSNEVLERRGFTVSVSICWLHRIQVCLIERPEWFSSVNFPFSKVHDRKSDTLEQAFKNGPLLLAKFRDQVCTTKNPPRLWPFFAGRSFMPKFQRQATHANEPDILHLIDERFEELEETVALARLVPQLHDRLFEVERMLKQNEAHPQDFFFFGGKSPMKDWNFVKESTGT